MSGSDRKPTEPDPEEDWTNAPASPYLKACGATVIAFVLFLAGAALPVQFRLWALDKAVDSITSVAVEIQELPEGPERAAALESLSELPMEQQGSGPPIRKRLVGSLEAALDQGAFGDSPDEKAIRRAVEKDLSSGSLPTDLLLHGILVLYFPALFGVMYFQAARGLSEMRKRAQGRKRLQLSLEEHVRIKRHVRWLTDESRAVFWRRITFALLIAMGTNYILSPAGMQASFIGEFASIRPPAGASSHPFAFEYFAYAPPYVVGLAGYYLYVSTTLAARFMAGNLSNRALPPLMNRFITVVVLGLVLSGITEGESLTRAIVFITAIFPESGLNYIAKVAQASSTPASLVAPSGFQGIADIDSYKQAALSELGISGAPELASTRLRELIEVVGIKPRVLIRACDRAVLIQAIGLERTEKLADVAVMTASDLVLYVLGKDAYRERWSRTSEAPPHDFAPHLSADEQKERLSAVNAALEISDASLLVDQLASNENVRFAIDNKLVYGGP